MGKTDPFRPLSYRDALDHLRVGYRRGLLVPFIGSGINAPRLRLWSGLVKALAEEAGIGDVRLGTRPTDQQLILASERIVWQLRSQGRSLADAMRTTLPNPKSSQDEPPPAATALASAWWPLILTTNYDSLLLDAFNKRHRRAEHEAEHDVMAVLGRSAADCHTLLASLNLPMRPMLWALQGFLGSGLNGVDLNYEIVLGYDHYRQATFENASFRAAFSEVYRNRSLLFVGTGLGEEYFRGLFGESIIRLGANQHAHCVLINKKDLKQDTCWFMHTRLNIVVLTYKDPPNAPKYSGFAPCLQEIADALTEPPRGARRFWVHGATPPVCVDIEPTPLPEKSSAKHWIVGSAGQGGLRVSGDVPTALQGSQIAIADHDDLKQVTGQGVLLAIAREPDPGTGRHDRDLRNVADVTTHALQVAVREGASTVSFMLLSASVRKGRWPRVFSLVQMLRGIRRFVQTRPLRKASPLRIVIHDTAAARVPDKAPDRSVWHAVETGRLDPAEVLDCRALRFFVEIEIEGSTTRTPMYVDEEKTVQQVSQYLQLDSGWEAVLEPNPAPRRGNRVTELDVSLLDAGVVPGSTLRFTRR